MRLGPLLLNNLRWKLLSVLLGTMVWLIIYPNTNPNQSRNLMGPTEWFGQTVSREFPNVKIRLLTAADEPAAFRIAPPRAVVTVRGPDKIVNDLKASDIAAMVNLADVKPSNTGRAQIQVNTRAGVTVVSVVPPDVLVERNPASPPDTTSPRHFDPP